MECECKYLIWLRKLQRLKILGLRRCLSIEELPDELGELKELRLLDVTGCGWLRRIPVNLIGRLKKLEELLIGGRSFEGWDVDGCDSTGGMNAGLKELNSLSHLAVLSLKIAKVECIPRDFVFPSLHKYDIILGNAKEYDIKFRDRFEAGRYPTSTRLIFSKISATSLNAKTFEQLFPTVSHIVFRRLEGLKNIELTTQKGCEASWLAPIGHHLPLAPCHLATCLAPYILHGCLPINRQCIQALYVHQERNKREEESERGKVIPHNCEVFYEIVSEVFSPNNREISVVLLLLERGCNSHVT
jgi:hypothetical protein